MFIGHFSEAQKGQFQAIVKEGQLAARTVLQSTLDTTDTVAHSVSTAVVMRWASWLHLSGLPKEVQMTLKDLLFKGPKLFTGKTDASFHALT